MLAQRLIGHDSSVYATRALQQLRSLCSASGGSDIFDVVVVGSGMVGSALVAALDSHPLTRGMRMAVVDRTPPRDMLASPLPPFPELRVSTLTPSTVDLLHKAHAWQELHPPNSADFECMQVWDSSTGAFIRWHAMEVGRCEMGYVVENSLIRSSLVRRYTREGGSGVECVWPATIEGLRLPAYKAADTARELVEVQLQGGRTLRTKLLVGADGPTSQVRQLSGLRSSGWSYHQRGVVATIQTEQPHHTAWQAFLPTGPVALLPVRDGYSNIVWSTTPQHAAALEASSPAQFAAAVNTAMRQTVDGGSGGGGGIAAAAAALAGMLPGVAPLRSREGFEAPPAALEWVCSPPRSFPLRLNHAGSYVRPRLALLGDAAHTVHPLAGQGVNLGFADVAALVDALAHAADCGIDIGDAAMLRDHYEAPRLRANTLMIAALDGIKRAFDVQSTPLASMRGLGLGAINASPPIKNRIMRFAMGM